MSLVPKVHVCTASSLLAAAEVFASRLVTFGHVGRCVASRGGKRFTQTPLGDVPPFPITFSRWEAAGAKASSGAARRSTSPERAPRRRNDPTSARGSEMARVSTPGRRSMRAHSAAVPCSCDSDERSGLGSASSEQLAAWSSGDRRDGAAQIVPERHDRWSVCSLGRGGAWFQLTCRSHFGLVIHARQH